MATAQEPSASNAIAVIRAIFLLQRQPGARFLMLRQRLRRPSIMTKAPARTANALPLVAGSISGAEGNGPAAIPTIAVPIATNRTAEKILTDPFPPFTICIVNYYPTVQIVREATTEVKIAWPS